MCGAPRQDRGRPERCLRPGDKRQDGGRQGDGACATAGATLRPRSAGPYTLHLSTPNHVSGRRPRHEGRRGVLGRPLSPPYAATGEPSPGGRGDFAQACTRGCTNVMGFDLG
jgi:hypothetical protein